MLCRKYSDFNKDNLKIIYSKVEQIKSVNDINHPVIRVLLKKYKITNSLEIFHSSDLPARSGIGSSSSFTVGLINVLNSMKKIKLSKKKLSLNAIDLEQTVLKENVGSQDQIAASYGGLNHIIFKKDGNFKIKKINISKSKLKSFQSNLLLVHTNKFRYASNAAKHTINNFYEKKNELNTIKSFVKKGVGIIESDKYRIDDIGILLNEMWKVKKKLAQVVSNNQIDKIYNTALEAGAVGGKLLGAGNGGFFLIYARLNKHKDIIASLKNFKTTPVKFDFTGSQIILSDYVIK